MELTAIQLPAEAKHGIGRGRKYHGRNRKSCVNQGYSVYRSYEINCPSTLTPLCKHRVLSFLWLAALRFLCVRTLTCYKLLAAVVVVAAVDVAVVVVVGGGGGG